MENVQNEALQETPVQPAAPAQTLYEQYPFVMPDPPKQGFEGFKERVKNRFRRNPNKIKESKLDFSLAILNIVLLVLMAVIIAMPLLSFFSLAFNDSAFNSKVWLFPKRWSVYAFQKVLEVKKVDGKLMGEGLRFWRAFGNSVLITVIITLGSNIIEAMAAYPLSKRDCPIRSGIMMYFVITMLFSAGIMPIYLLMSAFHLLNSIWSIVLISISNVGNLLYFKVFFEGLPSDIEEAARLDGASEIQMFFRIVIPMSLPVIGSCCFFSMVGSWNSYGAALLFITQGSTDAHPLAYYIYLLIERASANKNDADLLLANSNIQAAAMFLSIIPILLCYPYVIKYIKGGLMIGSVKE